MAAFIVSKYQFNVFFEYSVVTLESLSVSLPFIPKNKTDLRENVFLLLECKIITVFREINIF